MTTISSKFLRILQNLRCSSGLASTPVIRPRRFWDLHVPKTTWDYRARQHLQRGGTKSDLKRARDWVSIPEKNLPEPWTCDWARWPLLENRLPVEAVLPMRYAIGEEPLIPIMFASDNCAALDIRRVTLFACPQTNTFYLYRAPSQVADPGFEAEGMWRFDGVFSSVGAFIEKADWNRVEKLRPAMTKMKVKSVVRFVSKNIHRDFFVTDGRVVANQP
ncbi:hypothetical protein B0H13DRAFT_1992108 [Mycena leptocephala]|nr:hypothetical protein B0H13DRAFT_1992108 [Mycena leptocephala]